jgi:phosphatidate cytidylyltransferase
MDIVHKSDTALIILVAAASSLGLYELYRMAENRGLNPFTWLGLGGGILLVFSTHWWGWTDDGGQESWRLGLLLSALLFACFVAQVLRPTLCGTATNIAVTMLGILYVPFLCSFFIGISHLKGVGTQGVLFVIFVAKAGDIGAYSAGRLFGKRKLAPVVSPNKTVVGAVGGLALSIVVGLLTGSTLLEISMLNALGGSMIIAVAAQLGDLCESMIKRDLEVKDAGNRLPGFGGVLDLIDCLLTAAPVGYVFFSLIGQS